MKTKLTLLAILLASISYAQEFKRSIEPYTSLIVSRGVDVRLVPSNSNEATVKVSGIDPDDVIIESKGDDLYIKIATKSLWEEMEENHWYARIDLPYTKIENLEVTSGAKISSAKTFEGNLLDMQVTMGGELELDVSLSELIIDASMGGLVEITGKARELVVSANMGSEADLGEMIAEKAYVKSNMGSEAKVNVTKDFEGRANMGGEIKVSGNPDKFYESTTMGGEIRKNQ